MNITRGLLPQQVLQRGPGGKATVSFGGTATVEGEVVARVTHRTREVPGLGWRRAGVAHDGVWEARLAGLPTGGPWRVEAEIRADGRRRGRVTADGILVGDLWVLAGQSNMEGVGILRGVEPPHPLVHVLEMRGVWKRAEEPLHWLPESPDPVHWWGMSEAQRNEFVPNYRKTRDRGAGPGLAFARRLVLETGVPVGLIPCAHGGTNMEQWDPGKRDEGGRSLYGSMLRQVRAAGGRVAGCLWYQGESEGFEVEPSPFLERFLAWVAAARADLGAPRLPFLYVQIGRTVIPEVPPARWTAIRELQRLALAPLAHAAMVTSVDLPLDDAIHIATPGLKILGERLARQALRLAHARMKIAPGPHLARADVEGEKRDRIRVWYTGAHGDLGPDRNIRGFSVRDAAGADLGLVFDALPDPREPGAVLVSLRAPAPAGATLWYGWGSDPACTLVDAAGNAAPAFGPLGL